MAEKFAKKFTEKYMTVREVAEFLGLCRDSIYRMIRRGTFPQGRHFGKAHRWLLSEVQAWADKQRQEA